MTLAVIVNGIVQVPARCRRHFTTWRCLSAVGYRWFNKALSMLRLNNIAMYLSKPAKNQASI